MRFSGRVGVCYSLNMTCVIFVVVELNLLEIKDFVYYYYLDFCLLLLFRFRLDIDIDRYKRN